MRALEGLISLYASLRNLGLDDVGKESEMILTEGLRLERISLYREDPELSASQMDTLSGILMRRQKREPLQYILGHIDFYGLDIGVGPGVLIPRPETELLVEVSIKTAHSQKSINGKPLQILDLCTGSGCIALALGKHLPFAMVYATDISDKALSYAYENQRRNGIGNVTFKRGDLYEPVDGQEFDLIVSNPPYVRSGDIHLLQPEITNWEPGEALDGGKDGMLFYRRILFLAGRFLREGGAIILEIGQGETYKVIEIAASSGFFCEQIVTDYAGIQRVLGFRMRKRPAAA
jgi:release factor glutamine methyltransferase